jgi:hypothetical protein
MGAQWGEGLGAPAPPPNTNPAPKGDSPTAVAAATAAVVVGVVVVVKLIMVYSTAREVITTGRSAAAWAKQKRDASKAKKAEAVLAADKARANPIGFSSTGGRTVAYRVRLGCDPISETIIARRDGRATLVRQATPIATFRPTEYQSAKIRSGYGEILIFTDQL